MIKKFSRKPVEVLNMKCMKLEFTKQKNVSCENGKGIVVSHKPLSSRDMEFVLDALKTYKKYPEMLPMMIEKTYQGW